MPAKRNRLLRLVAQFEALPREKELRQAKIQIGTIADRVLACANSLEESFERVRALREVQMQPDYLRTEIRKELRTARAACQTLEQQVGTGGQPARIPAALENLKNVARLTSEVIDRAWSDVDTDILSTTEALIALTEKFDANVQRSLQQALDRFKNTRGAGGPTAISAYREARDSLMEARLAINLPGNVGRFLTDALRGVGSAQVLLMPEVKAFLDAHPALWTRLSVRLS